MSPSIIESVLIHAHISSSVSAANAHVRPGVEISKPYPLALGLATTLSATERSTAPLRFVHASDSK